MTILYSMNGYRYCCPLYSEALEHTCDLRSTGCASRWKPLGVGLWRGLWSLPIAGHSGDWVKDQFQRVRSPKGCVVTTSIPVAKRDFLAQRLWNNHRLSQDQASIMFLCICFGLFNVMCVPVSPKQPIMIHHGWILSLCIPGFIPWNSPEPLWIVFLPSVLKRNRLSWTCLNSD